MAAGAFGRRYGIAPSGVTILARCVPLCWLAVICLILSTYAGVPISTSQTQHPHEFEAAEYEKDAVQTTADCHGGISCSTFFLTAIHGDAGWMWRGQEVFATDQPIPELPLVKIDPPPPKRFV